MIHFHFPLRLSINLLSIYQITAITFVALGTSLPDTFASKIAAVSEKTADNAIGNVTGSNSVNVFMGLGIPWMIASIYHAAKVCYIQYYTISSPIYVLLLYYTLGTKIICIEKQQFVGTVLFSIFIFRALRKDSLLKLALYHSV